MANQSNPTASSVLDALNSKEEISSDDNESEHYNTSDCEFTEERMDQEIEHGGTESEQGNELTSSSSSSVPSLLSVLRAARLSDLKRKRKTQTNPGKPQTNPVTGIFVLLKNCPRTKIFRNFCPMDKIFCPTQIKL